MFVLPVPAECYHSGVVISLAELQATALLLV